MEVVWGMYKLYQHLLCVRSALAAELLIFLMQEDHARLFLALLHFCKRFVRCASRRRAEDVIKLECGFSDDLANHRADNFICGKEQLQYVLLATAAHVCLPSAFCGKSLQEQY